jgi:YesN/AraC family two-component response regulator
MRVTMDKKAVIIVDDEAIILLSLKCEIESFFGSAFIYETANSAEDAFEILDELTNDGIKVVLVISDLLMPGMKGDELLKTVKQKYTDIKTVLITGIADIDSIEKIKHETGISGHINKPWDSNALHKTLRSVLEKFI